MNATIELVSPAGVPVNLTVTPDADPAEIVALLERADKIGQHFVGKGWAFAASPTAGPSAAELDRDPTFAGYRCSPTIDVNGFPAWIIANDQQCLRRERQGDVWYSYRDTDGKWSQILCIKKGDTVPAVKGL